ncbi:MAG: PKD domain-containing protein, partial [Methanosarcinales archaeon]|nr:PKD domain-containing protein [Methanosarcinales archaeon]
MNGKLSIASMAIMLSFSALVSLMIASSAVAQTITVDGDGSDWDSSWFLAADPLPDTDPVSGSVVNCGNAGYNLTGVWQNYNATEDKLYFMYNVTGTAGDSDGDGDPNNGSTWWNDQYGVGDSEEYVLMINTSPTGDPYNYSDIFLKFKGNSATVTGPKAHLVSSVEAAINTTNFTSFVEFSVGNVTGWVANPYKYSLYGYAGSAIDFANEDWLGEVLYVTFPPVANFTFVAGDCNQTVWFDPSGSYDDPYGGIVNYTWDFGDDTGDYVSSNNSSFSHTFNDTYGTYNVNLTVIDTDGRTNSLVRAVMVNREPSISLVNASKTSVVEPGEWVLFQGWYSDPDGDTLMHRWSIDGVEIASGSSTNYSNASYFVNRTLTATLTVTDKYGCTDADEVTVTYLHRPVPVINFTATDCLEVELNASGSDPAENITTYEWDLDNDTYYDDAIGVTCTVKFNEGGDHTIGLRVTDDDGITNSTRRTIYVAREPVAVAEANQTNVIPPGGSVLFNGSNSTYDADSGPLSYRWNISGYIDHNVSVSYYVHEEVTADLTVTDRYNCTNTTSVTVTAHKVGDLVAVPVMTPAGMLALAGLLGIVGM